MNSAYSSFSQLSPQAQQRMREAEAQRIVAEQQYLNRLSPQSRQSTFASSLAQQYGLPSMPGSLEQLSPNTIESMEFAIEAELARLRQMINSVLNPVARDRIRDDVINQLINDTH